MYGHLFNVQVIVLLYLCQGRTEGIISWSMTGLCGADISHDEYGGELVFNTDMSPLNSSQCTITISPKPLNGHTNTSRIQFYFTEFTNYHDCRQTNVTLRDGRTVNDPVVEGLSSYLCSTASVTTNQIFDTSSPSLTIVYSSNIYTETTDVKFVIRFLTYHENSCMSEEEVECVNGQCIPSVYYNSTEIKACNTQDFQHETTTKTDSFSFFQVLRNATIIIFGILSLVCLHRLLRHILNNHRHDCRRARISLRNRCSGACNCVREDVCNRCFNNARRLCTGVLQRILNKCSKHVDNAPTQNENDLGVNDINTTTTSTANNGSGHLSAPVDDNNLLDTLSIVIESRNGNNPNISHRSTIHASVTHDDVHPNSSETNILAPPPEYGELFSAEYVYTPPEVELNDELPEVPSYDEAIRDSNFQETVLLSTHVSVSDNLDELPEVPSYDEAIRDANNQLTVQVPTYLSAIDDTSELDNSIPPGAEQNVTVSDENGTIELSPSTERRLQINCGFEHPFDFENDFDYYYSTDSDWDASSENQNVTVNEGFENTKSDTILERRLQTSCEFGNDSSESDWEASSEDQNVTVNEGIENTEPDTILERRLQTSCEFGNDSSDSDWDASSEDQNVTVNQGIEHTESDTILERRRQTSCGIDHDSSDSDWDASSEDQNVTVDDDIENTESGSVSERRLQLSCGFENNSINSDWDASESTCTSSSNETLSPVSHVAELDTIRTERSESEMESIHSSRSLNIQHELTASIIHVHEPNQNFPRSETSNLGTLTDDISITPPNELNVNIPEMHPELPPPYDEDNNSPPYYYDYLANVNMYSYSP